jgi:D-beta-D-heptose 7-phosphate kinase/D-beta-D-heptose 1-phosphate adenosyltransferase
MPFNLASLAQAKVLVMGDIMLDSYLWGDVGRISPEAPVPVVRVKEKSLVLGGAGNVAANLAGLGCPVAVIGVLGPDEAGERLKTMLDERGIQNLLLTDTSRITTTKTRVMAQRQQLLRLDEEFPEVFPNPLQTQLEDLFEKEVRNCNAVVLSDYGKGMFQTPEMCQNIIKLCRQLNIPVLVDPKGDNWERYRGATCITPNTAELELVTGVSTCEGEKTMVSSARSVLQRFDLDWLLVTRGPKGMCLVCQEAKPVMISARAREVFDVSGAGDTVIAALAAGLAAGLSFVKATELSNTAAGVVVGKLGTQPINKAELNTCLQMNLSEGQIHGPIKLVSLEAAGIQVQAWRTSGEKVIFTNGCYDLLHPGHIDLLHQANNLGDRLVVGLNTDASVKRLKGENRPILSEQDRGAILSALGCVDLVVLFDEDTPLDLIKKLRPDILVKGADYRPEEVVGREVVESYGGKVKLVPLLEGYSTTSITNKVLSVNR